LIEARASDDPDRAVKPAAELSRWKVPLSDLLVDDEIVDVVSDVVRSGWWSMGPAVQKFERAVEEAWGVGEAIAVGNGTAALHLALLSLGVGPGSEVVLPSLNFVAAANVIGHTGATPVFCDIVGESDLNLDPADLEAAISPSTKAVMVLHYGGHPSDMEAVLEIASRRGVAIIEDAAHAPGAYWRDRHCGTVGDIGCFSFFANKNLPVGEGGMVITDDPALAEMVRRLRSHGMTTLTWDRARGHAHSYDVVAPGFNYRLSEICAAIGITQLERLAENNAKRARLVQQYRAALDGRNGISMPFAPREDTTPSHHLAVAVLPPEIERDDVRAALDRSGVQTSVHYPPIHAFSQYRGMRNQRSLPRTDSLAGRILTLPLFPHMSDAQVATVVEALLQATDV
jgi:dTDP-4-amino-4,6-dideoxygalactose transaminase